MISSTKTTHELPRLSQLREGQGGLVKTLEGGAAFRSKMIALGILPGIRVDVLRGGQGGCLVVGIGRNRVMLGRGMAEQIVLGAP